MHLSFEHTSRYQVGTGLYGLLSDVSLSRYFLSVFWRILTVSGLDFPPYNIQKHCLCMDCGEWRTKICPEIWNVKHFQGDNNFKCSGHTDGIAAYTQSWWKSPVSWSHLAFVSFQDVWSHPAFFLLMYGAHDTFVQTSGWKFSKWGHDVEPTTSARSTHADTVEQHLHKMRCALLCK